MKKILYVDMDNVLVDFPSGISKISKQLQSQYEDRLDEVPDIFSLMDPLEGAIDSYKNFHKNLILTSFQLLHGKTQAHGVIKTNGLKNI